MKANESDVLPAVMRAVMLKSGMRPLHLQPARPWQSQQVDVSASRCCIPTREKHAQVSTLNEVIEPFEPQFDTTWEQTKDFLVNRTVWKGKDKQSERFITVRRSIRLINNWLVVRKQLTGID